MIESEDVFCMLSAPFSVERRLNVQVHLNKLEYNQKVFLFW